MSGGSDEGQPGEVEPEWIGTPPPTSPDTVDTKNFFRYLLKSWFLGILFIAAPCLLTFLILQAAGGRETVGYSFALLLLLPAIQGYSFGHFVGDGKLNFWRYLGALTLLLLLDYAAAAVILREGVICLIMATPLFLFLGGLGMAIVRAYGRRPGGKTLRAAVLPLLLFSAYDGAARPDFADAVSDAVTINAPPGIVWHYISSYPENTDPVEYWLWKIGMPAPVQSVASANKVGASRECRFTKGVTVKEKIIELVPEQVMTFEVTEQPQDPEILGHLRLDKGQLRLEKNADGTTTVIATSWYHLYVQPVSYFNWWAEDITRNVHFRVLNHMKALAEAEAAQKQP